MAVRERGTAPSSAGGCAPALRAAARLLSLGSWLVVVSFAPPAVAADPGPIAPVIAPDPDVRLVTLGPVIGSPGERQMPIGAFCPARPADPIREASTFGLTALLMWTLARRRVGRPNA